MNQITAIQMVKNDRVRAKKFRAALRKADLSWHKPREPWTVTINTPEHDAMVEVLRNLEVSNG